MQPELISALVGAGAATFVGGLALYGALRQAHAARRSAEVAAASSQQAAEQASHAAYEQWRRASQRDAAVAFALAADEAAVAARDLLNGWNSVSMSDEESTFRAMFRAFAVVRAEGPQALIDYGQEVTSVVATLSESAALYRVEVEEGGAEPDGGWTPDYGACESDYKQKIEEFRQALRAFLDAPPNDGDPQTLRPATRRASVRC
ncbi:hypothetical protein [Streptomyces parvulus]|uniref:hypothetical protein n=1 Tax=Streptomyces parvulus TaxID=146923 RepID=UPI0036837FAA